MRIAAAVAFCVVFGAVFWRAATEPTAHSTYSHCGAIDDAEHRLACFDAVLRRNSATDIRRMSFAEILMGLRNTSTGGIHRAER